MGGRAPQYHLSPAISYWCPAISFLEVTLHRGPFVTRSRVRFFSWIRSYRQASKDMNKYIEPNCQFQMVSSNEPTSKLLLFSCYNRLYPKGNNLEFYRAGVIEHVRNVSNQPSKSQNSNTGPWYILRHNHNKMLRAWTNDSADHWSVISHLIREYWVWRKL